MSISDDERWLLVSSWDVVVLNTTLGDPVFKYRRVGDNEGKLKRFHNVLPANGNIHDLGRLGNITFIGDSLVFHRIKGSAHECSSSPGSIDYEENRRECIKELRGRGQYQTYLDLFDLDTIELNSSPALRVETFPEFSCMEREEGFGLSRSKDIVSYQPVSVSQD